MHIERYKDLKDEEIIPLILEGNRALFSILYNRYSRKVSYKCNNLLKDKETAEDSVQVILEKAYEKLPSFKGSSSFSSWLYSITYNYCIDYLRVRKKVHYPSWNTSHEIPEIVEESEVDQQSINYERLLPILNAVHPEEKALLMMKYNDGISIQQIARSLRISESAAKMRIKRAKARVLYLYQKKYADV